MLRDSYHLLIDSKKPITLCWIRRDLRLHDHHALYEALRNHTRVLPLFIFDRVILDKLSNPKDARVHFIHTQLCRIKSMLEGIGSSLFVIEGNPVRVFIRLTAKYTINAVYTNEDYEPYAITRDREVAQVLAGQGIPLCQYKDQVIFSPNEVLRKDGNPYTIYTPYMKEWKLLCKKHMTAPFQVKRYHANFIKIPPLKLPPLEGLGFSPPTISIPAQQFDTSLIKAYDTQRNMLGIQGTTQLGIHLRFGTISIREATQIALAHNDRWLSQLIWRNFFMMILFHFPHVQTQAFKPAYDRILWRSNTRDFEAWCQGKTGYPIVDAGMRQLNATGFMHNRARMITASFLTKLLLIDWRWGEAYFAEKLLDYELASNNGNWQWAAGTGCDAAPYFRIFSPARQTERFDPALQYIKQWVPEYNTSSYPQPIVDYTSARTRALAVYKKALYKP